MQQLTKESTKQLVRPRKADSHKGTYGHALLIAGSKGKMGAAVIAAKACLRSGAGLVTVNVPEEERLILQTALPEAMLALREAIDNDIAPYSALGIGPGIGTAKDAVDLLTDMLASFSKPLLIDADGLNIIAANKKLFGKLRPGTVLTPHPKEFDRLFGDHTITGDREATAIEKAKALGVVIVLKGHQTLVTTGGEAFVNTTGNAGLAKGGSGDALTGIITALLAQGYAPLEAAKIGVYLHGLAADLAITEQSMESLLITDVIEHLGKAFQYVEE